MPAWQPGQSGNPKGRPRQQVGAAARLSRLIEEATDGGKELLQALLDELRAPAHTTADRNRRVNVIKLLLERWAGQPLATMEVTTHDGERAPIDLAGLNDGDLGRIAGHVEQVLLEAIARGPEATDPGDVH